MVYGAINRQAEEYYTYLGKVFDAIQNKQCSYNWLVTDCLCYAENPDVKHMLSKKYCWLTGSELTEIVQNEDFQWIWAVLSGFKKEIPLSEVLKYPLPYADGYEGFWKNPISIQHPLANIEIVSFDSSLTLIFSDQKELVDNFMQAFSFSEELSLYNTK